MQIRTWVKATGAHALPHLRHEPAQADDENVEDCAVETFLEAETLAGLVAVAVEVVLLGLSAARAVGHDGLLLHSACDHQQHSGSAVAIVQNRLNHSIFASNNIRRFPFVEFFPKCRKHFMVAINCKITVNGTSKPICDSRDLEQILKCIVIRFAVWKQIVFPEQDVSHCYAALRLHRHKKFKRAVFNSINVKCVVGLLQHNAERVLVFSARGRCMCNQVVFVDIEIGIGFQVADGSNHNRRRGLRYDNRTFDDHFPLNRLGDYLRRILSYQLQPLEPTEAKQCNRRKSQAEHDPVAIRRWLTFWRCGVVEVGEVHTASPLGDGGLSTRQNITAGAVNARDTVLAHGAQKNRTGSYDINGPTLLRSLTSAVGGILRKALTVVKLPKLQSEGVLLTVREMRRYDSRLCHQENGEQASLRPACPLALLTGLISFRVEYMIASRANVGAAFLAAPSRPTRFLKPLLSVQPRPP